MTSKTVMVGGPILLGVAIATTQYLSLNGSLHYLWALIAIVWGIWAYMQR